MFLEECNNGKSDACVWVFVSDKLKIFPDYIVLRSSRNNTTSVFALQEATEE